MEMGRLLFMTRGRYKGFILPNELKRNKGIIRKAIQKSRVVQSDATKRDVEEFLKNNFSRYCPLFEEEKFLGFAYFDFSIDALVEELQIILKHNEWGKDFWKNKLLLEGEDDVTEEFKAISNVFAVPMITDIRQLKWYGEKQIISQKSFNIINSYIRKMDLESTLNDLDETEVSVIVCRIPFLNEIGELTEDEKLRHKLLISGAYVEEPDEVVISQLQKVYGKDYSLWKEGEIACIRQYFASEQGIYKLADRRGKATNVVDGKRVTTDVPDVWQNNIYIIGPCTVQGIYVKDEDTIPSYIQRKLNKSFPDRYRVVNLGTNGFYEGDKENIQKLTLKKADIVIFINYFLKEEINVPLKMKYVDLTQCFIDRDKECFF